MKQSISNTLILLLILLFSSNALSSMLMSPYLQAVQKDSIYILVECDSPEVATVEYGPDNKYGSLQTAASISTTLAEKVTYVHKVKLKGLKPGKLYHYRALQAKEASQDYTFNTAVEEGVNFRFAWMADCRTGTEIHDIIAANIKKAKPRFSLYGGDLCQNGSYDFFKNEFFLKNELALIAEVPFFNTVGNHEGNGRNTYSFTEAPESASGLQKYYSFDYGDIHVLALNTELSVAAENAQYKFAKADLEACKKKWKIVITHVPAYIDGNYEEDKKLKKMTSDLFEPNKVDMVISGHSHLYQHNFVNGIHHMIIGSAGAPLATPKNDKPYVIKSVKEYNYAIVDVTPKSLHMVVYNEKEKVLDTLDLVKPNKINNK